MEYAIEILKKDKQLLIRCLEEWIEGNYPEAKKERDKRLKDIETAIEILTNHE